MPRPRHRRSRTCTRSARLCASWTSPSPSTTPRTSYSGCGPPLIIVSGAGSGKTALALEKLKDEPGEVLYVMESPYLASHARGLYHAGGFRRGDQEAAFLSQRELMESLRLPEGREAGPAEFAAFFARQRQAFRDLDPDQAYEEIRGVVTAQAGGVLTREAYRALGVRRSIFPADARDRLYDLFERYRAWLADSGHYDANLLAHSWAALD